MEWLLGSKMLIVSMTIVVLGIGRKFERIVYLHAITLYFSTVLHEITHFIVGKTMLLKVKGARFFPTIYRDMNDKLSIKAPRVEIESDVGHGFQLIPTALAPISLFYVAYYIELNWFIWFEYTNEFQYILLLLSLVYLLSIFVYNAIPSWTDLSYLLAYPVAAVIWFLIGFSILAYFDNDVLRSLITIFEDLL